MSITSTQITQKLRNEANIQAKKQLFFDEARYFVAQRPASQDFSNTIEGFYKGRKVIPGPKANPSVSAVINVTEISVLENTHFIRFIDNNTTQNAEQSVKEALFTIMDNNEADDYERIIAKQLGVKLNGTKGVSSKTTE